MVMPGMIALKSRVLLILVWAVLYLPGLGTLPLVDRDEPRFARATVEMAEKESWAVPYFNGEYRFDKPPLTYWWMSLHYRLFGVSEFSARLHSAIAALLSALLLHGFGRRLFGSDQGAWWAAAAFLTTVQVMIHGRVAVADMPMVATLLSGAWAAWALLEPGKQPRRFGPAFWVFWLSLALGILAKWVVTPVLLGLGLFFHYLFWQRKRESLMDFMARFRPLSGVPLMLVVVALWAVPAWIETGGRFFTDGFNTHVIERGARPFNERIWIPGYYLLLAPVFLFPWIGGLPMVIHRLRRGWNAGRSFLLALVGATYLVFSIAATQLPHYVLPAYPFFLLLLFGRSGQEEVAEVRGRSWIWTGLLWLPGGLAGAFLLGFGLWSRELASASAGLILLSLLALGVLALRRPRVTVERDGVNPYPFWAYALLFILTGAAWGAVGHRMEDTSLAQRVASRIEGLPAAVEPIATGYREPGLIFYSGREWTRLGREEALDRWRESPSQKVLLAEVRERGLEDWFSGRRKKVGESFSLPANWRPLVEELNALAGYGPIRLSGFNYARFSEVDALLWVPLEAAGDTAEESAARSSPEAPPESVRDSPEGGSGEGSAELDENPVDTGKGGARESGEASGVEANPDPAETPTPDPIEPLLEDPRTGKEGPG